MRHKKLIAFLSLAFLLGISVFSFAQVVSSDPEFPTDDQSVKIIFNAAEGNQGLMGFNGTVYAHTGVITSASTGASDWKYVKTSWGQNTDETKLTNIGTDLYELTIGPSIRAYYGVPSGEEIQKLAFVFRSEDSSLEGKDEGNADIFVDVFEGGLSVSFLKPELDNIMVEAGEIVEINAASPSAASMKLMIGDVTVHTVTGNTLTYELTIPNQGDDWEQETVTVEASLDGETATDEFTYTFLPAPTVAELPAGLKNGINYYDNDPTKVSLVLLAPNKEHVFVIGDFNDWQPHQDYYMNITPDGEQFWVTIDGLTAKKQYIFQYQIDDELRVADPFCDQVSDPWNDKWISAETYPNLIEYPFGKTEHIASVLQTDQDEYEWEIENFETPASNNMVVYELLIRDFTKEHTYNSLIDTLGYLERLGVNVIELMPVNEFEGNESWGYNPSFYFAPDKYYGPKNTLKKFVDECHKRGIAVVIDMVLNHAYGQCSLVRMYWDEANNRPAADNPWFNQQSPNPDYYWGSDFNHESEYTKAFVDSVNHYWISEYKVDGYRFDFTKGFTNTPGDGWAFDQARVNILKRMTEKIHSFKEDAFVILEHLADNNEEKILAMNDMLLWGNINHNYAEASMGWPGQWNFDWVSYQERGWTEPSVVGYMESHDEERIMFKDITYGNSGGSYNIKDTTVALKRQELTAAFFFPIPGPKMIWQFGELGYDYSIDFNGRVGNKPIRWDYWDNVHRRRLYYVYSALIDLKKTYPVFQTTNFDLNLGNAFKSISLYDDEMNVIVVGNFTTSSTSGSVEFPTTGSWYEYFSDKMVTISNTTFSTELQPGEYRMYMSKKVYRPPYLNTSIEDNEQESDKLFAFAYPQPAGDIVHFVFGNENPSNVEINIYNIQGQLIDRIYDGNLNTGSYTLDWNVPSNLPAGQYIYSIQTDSKKAGGKLMIQ